MARDETLNRSCWVLRAVKKDLEVSPSPPATVEQSVLSASESEKESAVVEMRRCFVRPTFASALCVSPLWRLVRSVSRLTTLELARLWRIRALPKSSDCAATPAYRSEWREVTGLSDWCYRISGRRIVHVFKSVTPLSTAITGSSFILQADMSLES